MLTIFLKTKKLGAKLRIIDKIHIYAQNYFFLAINSKLVILKKVSRCYD